MQPKSIPRFAQQVLRSERHRATCPGTGRGLAAKAVFVFCVALACGVAPVSRAAGPTNDFCSAAEVIPGNAGASAPHYYYTAPKDISLATTNGDPARSCQEFAYRSIWYSFTPNTNTIYTLAVCNDPAAPTATTVGDTVMAIYTSSGGCAGPFTQVDCNDDACGPSGLQSSITRALQADTTYYIVVWQYEPEGEPPPGTIVQLRVTRTIRPGNDTCATPVQVPLNFPVNGSTVNAEDNYRLAASGPCFSDVGQTPSTAPGRDVVYTFVAPRAGDYNFRVYNYSQNNLVLYVAGACPLTGNPALVTTCLGAANRSPASSAEEVIAIPLAANQRVFIFVDEHTFTPGSSFTFEVNPCYRETEPNNTTTNASYLACGITGTIQPGSDVDFYHLGSPPSGSRVFLLVNGEAASTTDFDLRVTTETDTLEYDDQDNDLSYGSLSPNIAGAILPGGPAYARVDFRGAPTEPYHVYAVVQPPISAAALEAEPNGTFAQASVADANYFYGRLDLPAPVADVDVYSFTAEGTELVFVSLDADPTRTNTPINARLELLDEFGNVLVTTDDNSFLSNTNSVPGSLAAFSPSSPAEAFVHRIANDGVYFVRVSASPGAVGPSALGDYLLSISKNCYAGSGGFNTPPSILNVSAPGAIENQSATVSGTISDPDFWQPHTVVINWGDGSVRTTNRLAPGVATFTLEHIYIDDDPTGTASDLKTLQITVTDGWGGTANSSATLRVNNATPVLQTVTLNSSILVNDSATLSATFSDAGPLDHFVLTVNWGDGTPDQTSNLPAGATAFNLTHQYTATGERTVSVTLRDDDNGIATTNVTVMVRPRVGAAAMLRSFARSETGIVSLRLEGTPGAPYHLEHSHDLTNWTSLAGQEADTNGVIQFEDPTAAQSPHPQRFYRAVSP